MTHSKHSQRQNFKPSSSTTRVFRHRSTQKTARNNIKNKKINNYRESLFGLFNIVFASAGIFSVISLCLIFAPNIITTKAAKAQVVKPQPLTIITNFGNQEYKTPDKGKSSLQPIQTPPSKSKQ